jgi:predicted O-linked N-acetylglucosamine transferase (SPINDLY family)
VFAPHVAQSEHLGRLQHADLVRAVRCAHDGKRCALDRRADRNLPGRHVPSRVAGSLLHAVGLPELIATDENDCFAAP